MACCRSLGRESHIVRRIIGVEPSLGAVDFGGVEFCRDVGSCGDGDLCVRECADEAGLPLLEDVCVVCFVCFVVRYLLCVVFVWI